MSFFLLDNFFPRSKKALPNYQTHIMRNNRQFSFLTAFVLILSAIVFTGGAYYLQDVNPYSRTIFTVLRSSHADLGGQSYYRRLQHTPRERDIYTAQMKTVLVKRDVVRPRAVVKSALRTEIDKAGRRTRIRGKNISIMRIRIGGRTVPMDQYVEGTRR